MADRTGEWIRAQLTLPNLVIVLSAAIGVGGYVQSFRVLEQRVVAVETMHRQDMDLIASTYQRKDVQIEAWAYVREQLAEIKAELSDLKKVQRRVSGVGEP